jgi:hypothetical protein
MSPAADELNEQIRAFWTRPGAHSGVPLTDEQRAEYQRLLAELQEVRREDVAAAA